MCVCVYSGSNSIVRSAATKYISTRMDFIWNFFFFFPFMSYHCWARVTSPLHYCVLYVRVHRSWVHELHFIVGDLPNGHTRNIDSCRLLYGYNINIRIARNEPNRCIEFIIILNYRYIYWHLFNRIVALLSPILAHKSNNSHLVFAGIVYFIFQIILFTTIDNAPFYIEIIILFLWYYD